MITHVRAFTEFHSDNTHVCVNVHEALGMKAHVNVVKYKKQTVRSVHVWTFVFVRVSVHICQRERETERD